LRLLVLGCGSMGSALAKHLARSLLEAEVIVADRDPRAIERAMRFAGRDNVSGLRLDFSDREALVRAMCGCDVVVGLAPGGLGYKTLEAAVEAGVDMVDLSFMPEDPMALDSEAREAGVTIIPDCGLAPGLSNILVGRAVSLLDRAESVRIYVGGIPTEPLPPLGYVLTWCAEDLIEEYTRRVRIVEDGCVVEVEPLTGLELVDVPGVGTLEAFYTDGLRTLLHTLRGVKEMWEKTLRYPGHVEKIRLLKDLGFFDEEPLDGVVPRSFTAKLLERKLGIRNLPGARDMVVMLVEVKGRKGGAEERLAFKLVDYYDEAEGITAMARTTAYTASVVACLLAKGEVQRKGVVPPEVLGMDERLYRLIISGLKAEGIKIEELGPPEGQ